MAHEPSRELLGEPVEQVASRRRRGPRCAACALRGRGRGRRRRPAAGAITRCRRRRAAPGRAGHPLPAPDRAADDAGHPQVALERGGLAGRSSAVASTPGNSWPGVGSTTPVSPRRGQHLLDVAQERLVRADEQHAAAGDALAVRVEQEGGAVQRDRGLAGARAALDDEHAGQRGADDAVLLGLDGGDDVAHAAGAVRVEGRRSARPRRRRTVERRPRSSAVEVEHLVLEADDACGPSVERCRRRTTPCGAAGGGLVERLGRRRAPVDEQLAAASSVRPSRPT